MLKNNTGETLLCRLLIFCYYICYTDSWCEVSCTGSKPPPMGDFTFIKIDRCRALLYGGRLQRETFVGYFIVDFDERVCDIIVYSNEFCISKETCHFIHAGHTVMIFTIK